MLAIRRVGLIICRGGGRTFDLPGSNTLIIGTDGARRSRRLWLASLWARPTWVSAERI